MPLPFPHGSGSGQIAHNSFFDTGATPGSVGGKFIGFGEYGTSAIANRVAWALSSNIDYIYQKYASAIAVPQVDKFTSAGDSEYNLGTLVFCGDSNYPVVASEGLMLLFAVLNDQYNALTDAAGNEVRVSLVADSTDTDSVYGTGFVQSPWIHFYTVNPITGAVVTDPYPIPNAQVVRIAYGIASSLELLPVDAFTRYRVMSGEEIPAGVLLLDGSLPMAGDLSLGSHNLQNCPNIYSFATSLWLSAYDPDSGWYDVILDATTASLNPNPSGFRLNLGTEIAPWGDLWTEHAYLLSDYLYANCGGLLGAYKVPLFAPSDYVFAKEDFGIPSMVARYADEEIGTWMQVTGVGAEVSHFDDVVANRSTVVLLNTTASGSAGLAGPILNVAPNLSLLKLNVGFLLPVLSNIAGDAFEVIMGFNPDTIVGAPGAYLFIDTSNIAYIVWNDGTGDVQDSIDTVTVTPNTWYDCTISFTATTVDIIINGLLVASKDFAVASLVALSSVPLRVTQTAGTGNCSAYIDYVEMYTEGHQPRALS